MCLYYEIKRLVLSKAHPRGQVTVDDLLKDAISFSHADFAAKIKIIHDAMDEANRLGNKLKPRYFAGFFSDKPDPQSLVVL